MSGVLEAILAQKAVEIAELRAREPRARAEPRGAEVLARLRRAPGEPLRLVTEIKRRSPSAGALSTALTVAARARVYAAGGAAMISVLADAKFFDGGWPFVAETRAAAPDALVLAKEFVLDERQIDEAAACGADAVLLIVRIVSPPRLAALVRHARARGLEPLVEIVDEPELAAALAADATVIGVNARDLDTLQMDAARAERVLAQIPAKCIKLHLSGLKDAAGVAAVARSGVDAALIGEALMRLDDPAPLLRAMRGATVS
ncbi:MAG: indole-3-glycerol-phosphate synthase [Labilithrix sp.]|nr:indole-3-glycerol-phosphate synthase [Labilithrix sp.]MCW5814239.1 indole-3-glycerol-phosphate synthase [Labilithrix sp.]